MASLYRTKGARRWLLQSPPVDWAVRQLKDLLVGALRQGPIPRHIAFVMDGNRRFAREQSIEIVEGHNLGFEALARILEVCYKSGIQVVTIYAFSIENFNRTRYEVDALMALAKLKLGQLAQHGQLLERYGARLKVLGNRSLLKPDLVEVCEQVEEMTKDHGECVLNVCIPYTSRDEIAAAVRTTVEEYAEPVIKQKGRGFSEARIRQNIRSRHLEAISEEDRASSPSSGAASDAEDYTPSASSTLQAGTPPESVLPGEEATSRAPGFKDPENISATTLDQHMFTGNMPPLELLIRTSGVERLSDFMLWQCHEKTDIVFTEMMWPQFDLWTFLPILVDWQWKRRKTNMDESNVRLRKDV